MLDDEPTPGEQLRALLDDLGVSQWDLARVLGLDVRTLQRYLAGSPPAESRAVWIRRLQLVEIHRDHAVIIVRLAPPIRRHSPRSFDVAREKRDSPG